MFQWNCAAQTFCSLIQPKHKVMTTSFLRHVSIGRQWSFCPESPETKSLKCRLKKTSKLRVTGLCAGNSSGIGEFPAQMASYAENVFIWWRHHDKMWSDSLRLLLLISELLWNSTSGTLGLTVKNDYHQVNIYFGHLQIPILCTFTSQALRSHDDAPNPIYVSPGNYVTLDTAVWVVKQCCRHRVPEPVRQVRGKIDPACT